MNYQDKLTELRKEKVIAIAGIETVEENKQEEIKETTKSIEDKYNIIKEKYETEFHNSVKDIHNYCKKIEEYSKFDINDMAYILIDLLNIFEGKKYILSEMSYHPDLGSPAQVQDILVIIEEENYKKIKDPKYLKERYLYHLIKNNKIILLNANFSIWKAVFLQFYKFSTGTINQNLSLKGYPYLKEFIDFVINYKLENAKKNITEEELEELKNQFITINKENIERQLEKNAETDMIKYQKEVEENLEHSKKLLKRRINKIENK